MFNAFINTPPALLCFSHTLFIARIEGVVKPFLNGSEKKHPPAGETDRRGKDLFMKN